MNYSYRYRLRPSDALEEQLVWTVDTCRQVYNHFLHRLNRNNDTSAYSEQKLLPSLKTWWGDLKQVHSKVLQKVVQRLYNNLSSLRGRKENGHRIGTLKWKQKGEYRSFTYSQSGFKLKNTSGRTRLWLSKLGEISIIFHRELPEDAEIKTVTVKQEPTGKWYAILGVETPNDPPGKPENPERCVGIDVGILKYTHDTDGYAVGSLDSSKERERVERAQRDLSRTEHGSANWEKQRRVVAERYADLKRKRRDFLHKLSNYYATEYDFVAVEDLDAKGLIELPGNSQNRASASWGTFLRMLEYKCEREGTHFIAVSPHGTTKECASCGVSADKPLWLREHSCPTCGFEADRDANAAWNILSRGLKDLGVGHSESTPVETALPVDTFVSAKRVVEAGSPTPRSERRQP
ncbi:IS200/IS605 family element transposase accessory protein TnpB [Haloferax sp. MBLA0076]|uniref:IS200/IS605 family element transposase accessory protein TnpB n=1 Tax=Haloferax litoreum TaxID=2666140 RepID=A0A6A8GH52_9EURY|nr:MULTISPECIES: RNA-guided endonuclease TnpB family protein [Haloferax]KAB1193307.1 IS200/IS605 family element transposase accessory protein TnpB [Haloferax sp. CBA1148]MRX21812.1 IS200/IS605 family element transposase accessory protein TnpB [Haloferax litoreum]